MSDRAFRDFRNYVKEMEKRISQNTLDMESMSKEIWRLLKIEEENTQQIEKLKEVFIHQVTHFRN